MDDCMKEDLAYASGGCFWKQKGKLLNQSSVYRSLTLSTDLNYLGRCFVTDLSVLVVLECNEGQIAI